MDKNIVLTGLMGSGKTTVGRLIAQEPGWCFVDTDELIENEAQKTINEIFEEDGEAYFRELESKIIKMVSLGGNQVISTGGGAVQNPVNLINLKKTGMVFYLKASAQELYNRIKNETHRPLINNDNPLETLENLLKAREKFYNQANIIIETNNKEIGKIVNEVKMKYKNYGG